MSKEEDCYGAAAVLKTLQRRDGMTKEEAQDLLDECRDRVETGEDPEEVLREELGLEPDYIFALYEAY